MRSAIRSTMRGLGKFLVGLCAISFLMAIIGVIILVFAYNRMRTVFAKEPSCRPSKS